jgi:hypothetical protein
LSNFLIFLTRSISVKANKKSFRKEILSSYFDNIPHF